MRGKWERPLHKMKITWVRNNDDDDGSNILLKSIDLESIGHDICTPIAQLCVFLKRSSVQEPDVQYDQLQQLVRIVKQHAALSDPTLQ
jgi:hypothetical protein